MHLSIKVVCFTNTFVWVISRTSSRDKVRFCIEFVNITFNQGTLGLNEMYLQFMDNIA